jgi:hypothetical protein
MEKFGKSANEMFESYSVLELMEMMAANKIQSEWMKESSKTPPPSHP